MTFHRQPLGQRVPSFVSPKLRKFARGQPCTLRLDGCDGGGETTVMAHIRRFGWAGVAHKPHDFLAVHACHACHEVLDSRDMSAPIGDDDVHRAHGETLTRLYAAGLMRFE